MITNRWLIVSGMVILIVMLVTGAFALGVYVGEHGWTRDGLQYQPGSQLPGGQPPGDQFPGNQPPGGRPTGDQPPLGNPLPPQGLPPGRPQIVGRIQGYAANTVILATRDGRRPVMLSERTRYLDETGTPLRLADFQIGDIVGIFGSFVEGDGGQFQANVVVKLPPPP